MDIENTEQIGLESPTSIKNQHSIKNILNQKGNFLIIMGVILIILIIVIGVGVYYLGTKNRTNSSQGMSPEQQIILSTTANTISNQLLYENNALIANEGNEGKLQLINILTKERKDLVVGVFSNSGNGTFSPDKKWVLFSRKNDLWKIGIDGTGEKQLTNQAKEITEQYWGVDVGQPKWSPNGKYILFTVNINKIGSGATKAHQDPQGVQEGSWIMDADGNNQKYIPQVKTPIGWMPDNRRIVFVDGNEYTSPTKTYDITTDVIKTILPNTAIKNLFWSDKGDKGLYIDSSHEDSHLVDEDMQQIDVLIRQGSVQYQDESVFQFKDAHTISPDGKYAIITELIRPTDRLTGELDANLDVYLWDTNNKEKIKLPIKFSLHTRPFWSNNSQKIVYLKQYPETLYGNENGYLSIMGDLYYYDLSSKKETKVTNGRDIDPFNIEF